MAQPETAVEVVGLTKRFGTQTIWEDLTFDIPKGAVSVLLGPSGTGKSVFLKHLVGLLKPTAGHLYVDGKDIPTLNEKEMFEIRKKFGVLFQDGALFGSMTILDNVAFPLREHTKLAESSCRAIAQEKIELVGLKGAEYKYPNEISGGMRKRAGLARALVLEPEILLFDEPDSGLDPVRTAYLNLLTLDLKRRLGPTILIVTHHIETARTVPDYIGLIFARHLVMFAPREEMLSSDEPVVRQFLHGSTEGPIGMSEEKDAAEGGALPVEQLYEPEVLEELEQMAERAGALDDTQAMIAPVRERTRPRKKTTRKTVKKTATKKTTAKKAAKKTTKRTKDTR